MKIFPAVLVFALVFPGTASAQTAPAAPTPCSQPNVAGHVVATVLPRTPPAAQHFGVGGTVKVAVTLDANNHIIKTAIASSTDPIFNAAAIDTADSTRFQGTVVNCVEKEGIYGFTVTFDPDSNVKLTADPMKFFPGRWRCTGPTGTSTETFKVDDAATMPTLFHTYASGESDEIFKDENAYWHARGYALTDGVAYPWVDQLWRFNNGPTEADYAKIDDRTFERTTYVVGKTGPVDSHTTRCTRG